MENNQQSSLAHHNSVARIGAHVISMVFHPIFLIIYFLFILYTINPYLFAFQGQKDMGIIIIYVVCISIIFPLIPLLMMYFLGMSNDFYLNNKKDRIIPIALTGIFYLWLYINMLNNNAIPIMFSCFLLGSTITLFICFFINLFTKISLHAAGIGGFMTGIIIAKYHFGYEYFQLSFGNFNYQVNSYLLIILALIVAGIVGTSRLILKAHENEEIYGGYIVGIISQIIAMNFLLK